MFGIRDCMKDLSHLALSIVSESFKIFNPTLYMCISTLRYEIFSVNKCLQMKETNKVMGANACVSFLFSSLHILGRFAYQLWSVNRTII